MVNVINTRFDLAVLFAQGFTQDLGRETGLIKLWQQARSLSSSYNFIMSPIPWNTDPSEIAKFIEMLHPKKLVVIAYSWGAGWFFRRFQKKYNGIIDHVILCDPVKRLHSLKTLSMTPWLRMELTSNVKIVSRFWQIENRPRSHQLKFNTRDTHLAHDEKLLIKHSEMEDSKVFHNYTMWVLESILKEISKKKSTELDQLIRESNGSSV